MTGKKIPQSQSTAAAIDEKPCAVCDRPAAAPYRPFCSKRCADVDLNRWLGEHYRIPTDERTSDPFEDNDGYS